MERSDRGAAQRREMADGAQRHRQIAGQRPHIGALPAFHLEHRMIGIRPFDRLETLDPHLAWRQFDRLIGPGQVVGAPAIDLDRGEPGRHLGDLADETRQHRLDPVPVGARRVGGGDLAVAIVRGSRLAPAHGEVVALVALHRVLHGLGRLAQGDRQHPRRHRIQGPGMPDLGRVHEALDPRHHLGRGHPRRLVDVQPAVDRLALAPTSHHRLPSAGCRRSATGRRFAPLGRRRHRTRSRGAACGAA